MEWFFWIIAFALVHTYVIYALLLRYIVRKNAIHPKLDSNQTPKQWPKVSVIISAYNEADVIQSKIENLAALRYPLGSCEILFGSDGSKDTTVQELKKAQEIHPDLNLKIFPFENNRGKAAVLNDLARNATGEILVLSDCNTMMSPTAIEELIRPLIHDPQIGCVNGRLILMDSGNTVLGGGESLYWQLETDIKSFEGRLGKLLGLNGALYAIRKELFPTLPVEKRLTDDFFVSVHVLKKGFKGCFAPLALGFETTSEEEFGEFKRKVRIGEANFNYLWSILPLLNPLRPSLAFIFISHKLLRWISPQLLIVLFLLNALLIVQNPILYTPLFCLQIFFYGIPLLGYLNPKWIRFPGASVLYYFVSMNLALLIGWWRAWFVRKPRGGGWERIGRHAEAGIE
jgi:cellulose synthase/poly-beta-1,6-N-acetylglucosamine synthase-like glycosyltransferase